MGSLIAPGGRTFWRTAGLILAAETVIIFVAGLLLGVNISAWIHEQTAQVVRISQRAATSADWSQIDEARKGENSSLIARYSKQMRTLSRPFSNTGEIYLVFVERGHAYEMYPGDSGPTDLGKAPQWELDAYSTGKTAYTPIPYSDINGTYLAAFTPISRNGKVIGLLAAEMDSATMAAFQAIVGRAFWLSLLPAILVSLIVSYVLALTFVEPMDVFRTVEETVRQSSQRSSSLQDDWDSLTPREKELAELARQGLTNPEIAEKLTLSLDTVKSHFKNIREKTGYSKLDLAVHAQARRTASTQA